MTIWKILMLLAMPIFVGCKVGEKASLPDTKTSLATQTAISATLTPSPAPEAIIEAFGADVDNDSTSTPNPSATWTPTTEISPTAMITAPLTLPTIEITLTLPISKTAIITSTTFMTTTWQHKEIQIVRNGVLNQAVWLPDGNRFAVAASTGLFLMDAESLEKVSMFNVGDDVRRVSVDPFTGQMVSGDVRGALQWRDPVSGKYLKAFQAHYLGITDLAYTNNGFYLASGSDDGTLRFWNAENAANPNALNPTALFTWHMGNRVTDLGISRDGGVVAGGSFGKVMVWDTNTGRMILSIENLAGWVNAVSFSPIQNDLAITDQNNHLQIWDTAVWTKTYDIPLPALTPITSLAFQNSGDLALGSGDGRVYLWNRIDNSMQDFGVAYASPVVGLAFNLNGDRLVAVYENGNIRLWLLQP